MKSIMKEIALAVLVALICGETALLVVQKYSNGGNIQWEKLSAPPRPAERIAWVGLGRVVVEAADGTFYSCSRIITHVCWEQVGRDQFERNGYVRLWQPSNELAPPELPRVTDIKYALDPSLEHAVVFVAAAIQGDGTVQVWSGGSDFFSSLATFLAPFCAGLLGLFATPIAA